MDISVRSYTKQKRGHWHTYHQLVLPLSGAIDIELEDYRGKVSPGQCVVVKKTLEHIFRADEAARFLVVDSDTLPEPLLTAKMPVFSISTPLQHYIEFLAAQLEQSVDTPLESQAFELFTLLLARQEMQRSGDARIQRVKAHISAHIDAPMGIESLSRIACLSATQFKSQFKKHTGQTVHAYITAERMSRAHALLTHTDLSIARIAEQCGYQDASAFSRRFQVHFSLSPKQVRHL